MAEREEIERLKTNLGSAPALESIERDPYWPKWNSPWWQMSLLNEIGLANEIPRAAVDKMVQVLKHHYLPVFPIRQNEIPEGTDYYRQILCLCAVGNMYQVLFNAGANVDAELPWMREWLLRYQLADGGLNCDEKVYTKPVPKSSIMTTVPCLEAILFCSKRELTAEEIDFLNKGASYLVKHRLFRKVSTGEVIDKDWLEVKFPRFYDYDFLRGYYLLEKWRQRSGFSIPDDLVDEVEELVSRQLSPEGIRLNRYNQFETKSYNPTADGKWVWGDISEIELMKKVSYEGAICEVLTARWNEVKPKWAVATEAYETVYKNPIQLKAGERVQIEKRETNPDWLGWVYCMDNRGVKGWVSEKYLKESGETAIAIKDYDATELSTSAGDRLRIYFEEFGWCWCRNAAGEKGWLPKKILNLLADARGDGE